MEQFHFAIGASIPFFIALFYYNTRYIFLSPFIMTLSGFFASLPYYLNLKGNITNIFLFYDIINSRFSNMHFKGYAMIYAMFIIIISLQLYYIYKEENNNKEKNKKR